MWWKQNRQPKQPRRGLYELFVRMNSGQVTEAERRDFERWQWEHPDQVAEYYALEGLWHELGLYTEALPAETLPAHSCVKTPIPEQSRPGYSLRWPAYAVAATLLVVVAAVALINVIPRNSTLDYHTARGERLVVNLEDGSTLHLSSLTAVRVAFNDHQRRVTLVDGEALFEVAQDSDRPFIVHTPYGEVQALGTAFNISTVLDDVRVTVIEGTVMVQPAVEKNRPPAEPVIATRGKQIRLARSGQVESHPVAQVDQVIAWTRGKLVFAGEPLYLAVEQVNRHAKHRISVKDSAIRNLPIYGVFNTGDASGFISAVKEALPVRSLEISGNTTVLLGSELE